MAADPRLDESFLQGIMRLFRGKDYTPPPSSMNESKALSAARGAGANTGVGDYVARRALDAGRDPRNTYAGRSAGDTVAKSSDAAVRKYPGSNKAAADIVSNALLASGGEAVPALLERFPALTSTPGRALVGGAMGGSAGAYNAPAGQDRLKHAAAGAAVGAGASLADSGISKLIGETPPPSAGPPPAKPPAAQRAPIKPVNQEQATILPPSSSTAEARGAQRLPADAELPLEYYGDNSPAVNPEPLHPDNNVKWNFRYNYGARDRALDRGETPPPWLPMKFTNPSAAGRAEQQAAAEASTGRPAGSSVDPLEFQFSEMPPPTAGPQATTGAPTAPPSADFNPAAEQASRTSPPAAQYYPPDEVFEAAPVRKRVNPVGEDRSPELIRAELAARDALRRAQTRTGLSEPSPQLASAEDEARQLLENLSPPAGQPPLPAVTDYVPPDVEQQIMSARSRAAAPPPAGDTPVDIADLSMLRDDIPQLRGVRPETARENAARARAKSPGPRTDRPGKKRKSKRPDNE